MDKQELYKAKFGEARMGQLLAHVGAVGQGEGIAFKFGGRVSNTTTSHRLNDYAYAVGGAELQDKVVNQVFRAYFEEEKDLGNVDVLVSCAVKAGMDEAKVRALLTTSEGRDDVLKEVRAWTSRYRITGVPYFVVNGSHRFSGAQDPATFLDVFEAITDA